MGQTASANGEGFGSITALRAFATADDDDGLLLRALLMLLPADEELPPAGLPNGWHLRRFVGR